MARGVNKVILIGHLGKDPESKAFPNGDAFCNVSLATSESWTDKTSGEKKERTEWHNLVFTRRLAEIVCQYCRKGSKVYVEGSLRTRKWQDKEGHDRYTTEIQVNDMQMLDGRNEGGESRPAGGNQQQRQQSRTGSGTSSAGSSAGGFEDDDIPFAPRSGLEAL